MIAGGLGGLGRSIARWMTDKGARYLILLGLSTHKSTAADNLIEDLKRKQVVVEHRVCDIADLLSLKHALEYCGRDMPPIKGCIQAAMILRVS